MPAQGVTFGFGGPRDTILAVTPDHPRGMVVVQEGQAGLGTGTNQPLAGKFWGVTGSTSVPDVSSAQTSSVTLFPDDRVPSNMRCYLTSLTAELTGNTQWTNSTDLNSGVIVTDTSVNALPAALIPLCALQPGIKVQFPENAYTAPYIFGYGQTLVVTSYTLATKTFVLTTANSLITTTLAGFYVTITDSPTASDVGRSALIASNTSTNIVLTKGFINDAGVGFAPHAHAVYSIPYWVAASGSATTAVITEAGNQVTGTWAGLTQLLINTPGSGTILPAMSIITGNVVSTSNTLTTGTRSTYAGAGSVLCVTSNPGNCGAVEFGMNGTMQLSLGKGLQASLLGAAANFTGSNVRLSYSGFIAP